MFNREMIEDYAEKLLIGLSDEEINDLLEEFDAIKANMDIIAGIDNISSVEPLSFVQEIYTENLRDDDTVSNLSTEDVVKNAGDKIEDVVVVPKVVG